MKSAMVEREGFAALVLRLRAEGISDIDLLTAVEQTPRSQFVPAQFAEEAYSSRTIPIDCGAFMESADMVVKAVHRLQVKPGQRVLEIGTGSGFMTAILGRRSERVVSIDRYKTLVQLAQNRMDDLGLRNVVIRQADGTNGLVGEGTFDRIISTAAFTAMPRFFTEQIVSGGMMVAPIILEDGRCVMTRFSKTGSRFEREELFETPYLPMETHIARYL
ncbi:protein-L-isoaspartate(D-aspartate) O-methyltransferase [Agrobacterium vaccinii]|uniref:protein-L-isoaspartate(D-aspartate) O-methyltransferase n=1 Tax=Agrobacterium vaccinii TaxID=2735528 RepID=UPI0013AED0B7|nr:protein-L-isoaspartate(D-aspartate) O-methyltransferase [Agrobacterium vaccinii]UHS56444.1 protein-L-isoaspartate(D-aspartate) O-methyltransferase [Agrobacterium vaccinii]UHS61182.1 protein-L-isoaspartate(D-aspartate) O-methyltransferase [Agrobacterium vaccinii]